MLDGVEVAIEGAKDQDSLKPTQESSALLNILGGSRSVDDSVNRSLPIDTIANILGGQLGTPVSPTGKGVNGALAQMFGGDAGKLMRKFLFFFFLCTIRAYNLCCLDATNDHDFILFTCLTCFSQVCSEQDRWW